MKVEMTKAQCIRVVEFIEMYLFHAIREDGETDNIDWLYCMLDAMKAMRKAVDEYEGKA